MALAPASFAQSGGGHAVDASQRYHRLVVLAPLTGTGRRGDPIRPDIIPGPVAAGARQGAGDRSGIIAWSFQLTDDKKAAIVQLVAVDPKAFAGIVGDKRPEVRVFDTKGHGKDEIESEMKKYKKDYSLDGHQVVAQ
jgi:hypothetical protein